MGCKSHSQETGQPGEYRDGAKQRQATCYRTVGGGAGKMKLRAILFDAVGTLIHLPCLPGWHYREVALRHGIELQAADLQRAFRKVFQEMPPREVTPGPRADDDKGWWRDLVARGLMECGARVAEPEELFEDMYARFAEPGVWEAYPEVREVLAELSQHHDLAVVSNFDRRLLIVLRQLGLDRFFREIVLSSEVGADKPAPEVFNAALRRLGVTAAETVHVGDDTERDWAGARAVGLQVWELDRPRNSLRDLVATLRRGS